MKKILVRIGIVLVAILLAVVVIFSIASGSILRKGVEVGASEALKVDVTLEKASLSLLAGKVGIKGLVVSNPEGYSNPNMLELGKAKINVKVGSLLSDTVVIEDIQFDDMTLVIEQKGLTNNLQEVIDSLSAKEPGGEAEPEAETEVKDEAAAKNLRIDNLDISNVSVKVKLLPLAGRADTVTFKLDPIKMTDLGSDSKIDIATLAGKILTAIAVGVATQGADLLPMEMIGPLSDKLQKQGEILLEAGREVLEKSGDIGKDILEGGKDVGEDIKKGLEGLFKGKKK